MRVLVVEDDRDQAIIRCMLLSHHGFETRRAGTPEEALRAVKRALPEVAVVDLGLPDEQDGMRLIADLKANYPSIRVVVLTGANVERLKGKPELADAAGILQKGASCKALLSCLTGLLGLAGAVEVEG